MSRNPDIDLWTTHNRELALAQAREYFLMQGAVRAELELAQIASSGGEQTTTSVPTTTDSEAIVVGRALGMDFSEQRVTDILGGNQ